MTPGLAVVVEQDWATDQAVAGRWSWRALTATAYTTASPDRSAWAKAKELGPVEGRAQAQRSIRLAALAKGHGAGMPVFVWAHLIASPAEGVCVEGTSRR